MPAGPGSASAPVLKSSPPSRAPSELLGWSLGKLRGVEPRTATLGWHRASGKQEVVSRWREAETSAGFLSGQRKCLRQSCLMGVGCRLGCFHVSWTPLAVPPVPVLSALVTRRDLHLRPRQLEAACTKPLMCKSWVAWKMRLRWGQLERNPEERASNRASLVY